MTVKINDTLVTSNDLQGQTADYFDTGLKLLAPSSSDDKIKRLLSCDAEKQYLQYKATQSIPYDLTTTHNIQIIEQPADNTELYEYNLGSDKCKDFNLTFKVKDEAVIAGTKFLLEQPGLLSCKSQDNTLYFKIPEWDNAWKKVDPEVLKSNNTITLEAYNSGIGINVPYYAYTNNSTTYYTQDSEPADHNIAPEHLPYLSVNGTMGGDSPACAASHESQPAWWAFDGDVSVGDRCWWTSHGSTSVSNPCWITYYTPTAIKLYSVDIYNEVASPESPKTGVIQGSNDNSTWTDLAEIHVPSNTSGLKTTIQVDATVAYKYFRFYFTESWGGGGISIQEINLFKYPKEKSIIYSHTNNEFTPLNPQPEFTTHIQGLENASVVGTLTDNDGIYSGFSTSNYFLTDNNFNPQSSNWEIIIKFKTSNDISTQQAIIGGGGAYSKIILEVYNGHFRLRISSNNSSFNVLDDLGTYDVQANTDYIIRCRYNNTTGYTMEYKTLNSSYQLDSSTSDTTAIYDSSTPLSLGANKYNSSDVNVPFSGNIDMKESFITIDGVKTTFYSTFTGLDILDPQIQSYVQYPRNTQGDLVDTVYFADRLKLTVNDAEYTLVDNLDDMPIIKTGVLAIREDLRR